jgi:citrate synthase
MYDEIAAALVAQGAEHLVVPGFGHRPQDDPRAPEWMTNFWTEHEPS